MIWNDLRGHRQQVEMFRRAIRRGRAAQAYLFIGPKGIGKREFARRMAQSLFCRTVPDETFDACGECTACKQVRAGTHPDLLMVGCPDGKKELPIELIVGPQERRGREGLCHDLSLRPMAANRRIAIIDDAETMNEASANALLKTLEEPPPGAILFLLTADLDPILPTIRSRCQPVRFSPLPADDLAELLLESGAVTDRSVAGEVASLAGGSLETARDLLEPELRELRHVIDGIFDQSEVNGLTAWQQVNDWFDKQAGDTADQRRRALWMVRFAVEQLRQQLRVIDSAEALDRRAAIIDRCMDAELHLRQAMPVPLCLEGLFDAVARISRGDLSAGRSSA